MQHYISMIRAIIFDLDCTLVDSFGRHLWSYNEAAKRLKLPQMPRKYLNNYNGQTAKDIISKFLKKPYSDKTVEDVAHLKRDIFLSNKGSFVVPMPGAIEIVNAFYKRKLKIAVASSARRREIEIALKEIGLTGMISAISSANDIRNSKPDPEIFLKAAEKLNIPAKDCLVFEDSVYGVMGAKAAGMKCIAVATGTSSKTDLKKLKPDLVVNTLKDILPPKLDKILSTI